MTNATKSSKIALVVCNILFASPSFANLDLQNNSHEQITNLKCDHYISRNQHLIDGQSMGVNAGQTLCLEGGTRGPLRVRNVQGSASAPIIIRNQDSVVTFSPYEYSIAVENSQWLRITSKPVEDVSEYGLQLGGTLGVGTLSEQIEIDHIEIYRARFAGMLIKTDPTCDAATWAENFTMTGIRIHNNYIHDTESGEGMYIGYTGRSRTLLCDNTLTTVYPHKLQDVHIFDNKLENIGADGIQVNSIQGNTFVNNNTIYRTGVSPFDLHWQNTGIQIGGNDVEVRDNLIYRSGGNGMMIEGDAVRVLNNHIIYAGENGIFARNMAQQDASIQNGLPHDYKGNLIIHPGSYALKLYAINTVSAHRIIENSIENDGSVDAAGRPKTFSYLNDSVLRHELNNHHYVTQSAY
ncbi:right-handed parallel beta-helix repeat-containing protein [Pseudoalteromonas luteoviolacea]|uniref:right-handed parallel beta-helix repeat-containing protein n=1 Tax=Pseudoalteromonas luteoviolacea TaxID=43657 RepID=UPI001B37DE77|nr:right-handed parallel beta-helix repeat-containing protein [Pseudoalteromonas luteoviolacea]MBQ4837602.1 right-handed parallel beta-helix repeat-containing protein [Pseudoalteromonas luteoviolacea]